MDYQTLHESTKKHGETRDCTVKAVALALGTSYEDAWNLCRAAGRTARDGMSKGQYIPILTERGLTVDFIDSPAKTIKGLTRMGLRGRYLVWTAGHVLYFENGKAFDWSADKQKPILYLARLWGAPTNINPECKTLNKNWSDDKFCLLR